MKTTTSEAAGLLQSERSIFMVELYTLTLRGSQTYRWGTADVAVRYGLDTWFPGPIIERGSVRTTLGLGVVTCDVSVYATDAVTVLGTPLLLAARRGVLDGAELRIERAFTASPDLPIAGTVHVFEGRVANVEILTHVAHLSLKSHTELLDSNFPVDVYQPGCLRKLYSPACGANKASSSTVVTVGAGSTRNQLACGVDGSGVFELGEIVGLTGPNAGVGRTVKRHTAESLLLSYALPEAPLPGDTFKVFKGCDKTQATCNSRFPGARFKGFPFVPKPETAV